jgi:hypothetical protein
LLIDFKLVDKSACQVTFFLIANCGIAGDGLDCLVDDRFILGPQLFDCFCKSRCDKDVQRG